MKMYVFFLGTRLNILHVIEKKSYIVQNKGTTFFFMLDTSLTHKKATNIHTLQSSTLNSTHSISPTFNGTCSGSKPSSPDQPTSPPSPPTATKPPSTPREQHQPCTDARLPTHRPHTLEYSFESSARGRARRAPSRAPRSREAAAARCPRA